MRLSEVTAVTTAIKDTDSVLIEVSGNIRRVTIENFRKVINSADAQLLNSSAFGVQIDQSSEAKVRVPTLIGSDSLRQAYLNSIGRYYISRDGSKAAKLMSTDSTKYADGTAVSSTTGDAFVRLPKLYYKVETSGTVTKLWLSQNPISDKFFEESWVGAYLGYVSSSKLRSVAGYAPTVNKSINDFHTYAKANGENFGLMSYNQWVQICMLFLANFKYIGDGTTKNNNSQTLIGYGATGSNSLASQQATIAALCKTGTTTSLGDATGRIPITVSGLNDACNVSIFGIENLWGLYGQMLQGLYFGVSSNASQDGSEVFIYKGNRVPTTSELANIPTGEYRKITRATSGGYVKSMVLGEFFDMIGNNVTGGSASTYYPDWQNNDVVGQYIGIGGYIPTNSSAGIFCYNTTGGANANYTARLAYYGKPKIVDKL